jgi:hypothetical protein
MQNRINFEIIGIGSNLHEWRIRDHNVSFSWNTVLEKLTSC